MAWLFGALLSTVAVGQGTVNLNNNFVVPGTSATAFVLDSNCLPMARKWGRVQVLDAQGMVITPDQDGLGIPFVGDGLFDLGTLIIPGSQPGGWAALIIRAWDSSSGLTWDVATVRGDRFLLVNGLGGGGLPPPSLAEIGNFRGIETNWECRLPEPGTWALAVTGFLALGGVMHRQRQRSRG